VSEKIEEVSHRAGFVSIIGKPNAGKSTLMNSLMGEKLSIITSKVQTTRHRIMGIMSGADFQIVYSDTPGLIQPHYELHKAMMRYVYTALEDSDVLLFLVDAEEEWSDEHQNFLDLIQKANVPIILLLNKIDKLSETELQVQIDIWKEKLPVHEAIISISALNATNLNQLVEKVRSLLPLHPAYFDKDELTDKTERFLASEIIREKIFLHYEQEIPYCCDVAIMDFKDKGKILYINAMIYVERQSQKHILIGTDGNMLKKMGTDARKDLEAFFGKKVFLEQFVKVVADWRKSTDKLKRLGY
jgi:GTPase